jgi:hypothetical protein
MRNGMLLLFLLLSISAYSQRGALLVKKRGLKKVHSFAEGAHIRFYTSEGDFVQGMITLVKGDSIYVNHNAFPASSIRRIVLRDKKSMVPQILLTTAGVAAASGMISLAGGSAYGDAVRTTAAIGYGSILLRTVPKLKRKKYPIRKKFTVQTLDLHF